MRGEGTLNCTEGEGGGTGPVVMFIYEETDIFIVGRWRGREVSLIDWCCICGQFIANLESDPYPATQISLYLTTAGRE